MVRVSIIGIGNLIKIIGSYRDMTSLPRSDKRGTEGKDLHRNVIESLVPRF